MQEKKVLVVGAGVTGAALARLLRASSATVVTVWEKNNIVGGRMMARSFRKNRGVHVDVGAQYLTRFAAENDDVWFSVAQHLAPFDECEIARDTRQEPRRAAGGGAALEHAICPDALGFRSLVQHLLEDTPTTLSREMERFEVLSASQIRVTAADGHEEIVSDLVLTCPVPSVLSILEKSWSFAVPPTVLEALNAVQYSQRFALAYLYGAEVAVSVRELGWTCKYVSRDEDDVVRYLCWDNLKKQSSTRDEHYALLVHTTVAFGAAHMDNKERDGEIVAAVTASVSKLLPFLPATDDVLLHRWRVSQVASAYASPTGKTTPTLVLSHSPKIVVAGDAFLSSTFDNCLLSAKAAAKILTDDSTIVSGL